jgi:hypothetical protein
VKPRQLKLNAHRTLEYFTPEDVAAMRANSDRYVWLRDYGRTTDHDFDELQWDRAIAALGWTKDAAEIDAAVDDAIKASKP